MSKKKKLLIVTGGGPAPVIADVQHYISTTALSEGVEVWATQHGCKYLKLGEPEQFQANLVFVDEQLLKAKNLLQRGGSLVASHRTSLIGDPKDEISKPALTAAGLLKDFDFGFAAFIGGDDTGSSACRTAQAAATIDHSLLVGHYDKTIDDDQGHIPYEYSTFGADTAAFVAAQQAIALSREVEFNPWRVFLLEVMGRKCGRPAISTARYAKKAGRCPEWTLILEQLVRMGFSTYVHILAGGVIKSRLTGRPGGVMLVSEGNVDSCTDYSIGGTKDDYGHQSISQASFADDTAAQLNKLFAQYGFKDGDGKSVNVTPYKMGYGRMRCGDPTIADVQHAKVVGIQGTKRLLQGSSGCTFYWKGGDDLGEVSLLEHIQADTKRIPTRRARLKDLSEIYGPDVPFLTLEDLSNREVVERLAVETHLSPDEFVVQFGSAAAAMNTSLVALRAT